jgi:hypothetical protein
LKSSGTTSRPSSCPALGTPVTGGRGRGGRCRTMGTGMSRATGRSFSVMSRPRRGRDDERVPPGWPVLPEG